MQPLLCPNCNNVSVGTATLCECCGYAFVAQETYYSVLGVSASATADEIRSAYRRKVNEWHPDRNRHRPQEAHEMTVKINAAVAALKDETSRRAYDDHLRFVQARSWSPPPHAKASRSDPRPRPDDSPSSIWAGSAAYRLYEAGFGSTMLVGIAAWLIAVSLLAPCFSPFLIMGLRFAFYPSGRWVGFRTILLGMATWLLLPSLILFPVATLPLLAMVAYGLWSTKRIRRVA